MYALGFQHGSLAMLVVAIVYEAYKTYRFK